jgi:carbon storage regulator
MLVVTRKRDQKLMIGNEIEVQVLKIGKDSVRIGVKAPQSVSVHRYEVYEQILASNLAAAQSQIPQKQALTELRKGLKIKPSK